MADTAQTVDSNTAYFFSSDVKKIGRKKKSKTNGGTAASPAADAFDRFSSSGSGPETPIVNRDADDDVDVEEEPPSTAKRIRLDSGSTVLVHQSSTIPPEFLDAPVTCKKITHFFDFLTMSNAAGHPYDISKRNALIKKEAKKEIYYKNDHKGKKRQPTIIGDLTPA